MVGFFYYYERLRSRLRSKRRYATHALSLIGEWLTIVAFRQTLRLSGDSMGHFMVCL